MTIFIGIGFAFIVVGWLLILHITMVGQFEDIAQCKSDNRELRDQVNQLKIEVRRR